MISLQQIESDLVIALKARNQLAADTLRSLKTRIKNEEIAQGSVLTEDALVLLVQSEIKRRNDAHESFTQGGRADLAEKEQAEIAVLNTYLPPQASNLEIVEAVDALIQEGQFSTKDFGMLMGKLKQKFGTSATGGQLSTVLKEKLK